MRVKALILVLAVIASAPFQRVTADEVQDVSSLEKLETEIKKIVPKGWVVKIKIGNREEPRLYGHPQLALTIESEKPLSVNHDYPNAPGRISGEPEPEPNITQKVVVIGFVVAPYVSPADHAHAKKRNTDLVRRRSEFERRLEGIGWGHKGSVPVPPDAFHPKTAAETRLVREYAMLWLATEPQPLPTHYAGNLSFEKQVDFHLSEIQDKKRSEEYFQMLKELDKLFRPYEKEGATASDEF